MYKIVPTPCALLCLVELGGYRVREYPFSLPLSIIFNYLLYRCSTDANIES